MTIESVHKQFNDSAAAKLDVLTALAPAICAAVDTLLSALVDNHKVLACGEGRSALHASYFSGLLVSGYERERPALAGIALRAADAFAGGSAEPNDQRFAIQVRALGQPGDILFVICAEGGGPGIVEAVHAAHERDMTVIALTGPGGEALTGALSETDVNLNVGGARIVRVHEIHQLILHCLCDGIDAMLLGEP